MRADQLTRHYKALTPEERFQLILSAEERDDDIERERLKSGARIVQLGAVDYAPYFNAFRELSTFTFIELTEYAATLEDLLNCLVFTLDEHEWSGMAKDRDCESEGDPGEESEGDAEEAEDEIPAPPPIVQLRILIASYSHQLCVRFEGWKLFCQSLKAPPFILWQHFPGLKRLQERIEKAEGNPAGESELLELAVDRAMTPEALATGYEEAFRTSTRWWGAGTN